MITGLRRCAVVAVLALSGCAAPSLEHIPLPAPSVGSQSYTLTATFANALNLPLKAKVRLGGADIGQVVSMTSEDYTAVVTMQIRDGVALPVGSTAELRTATPLGDVYVAVKPPPTPGQALLADGDNLGLGSTGSAATVEAVLSSAAVLVNGGVVRNLTKLVNGVGTAAGDNGDAFRDLVRQSAQLTDTLSARSQQIRTALDNTAALIDTVNSRQHGINELLAASSPAIGAVDTRELLDLLDTTGAMSAQLARFPSLQGTDTRSMVADMNALSRGFNDVVVSPDTSIVAMSRMLPPVVKATSGTAIAGKGTLAKLALGSMPDIGYLGDPQFHGPKRADWHFLVGSLKYTLFRLQERVVGKGP
ncbi:MlaD family protein [Mycolicibacterium pulveris]|uniref:MlaD family protein n=1 Tax=Mycolicibacterium pulveris TaxID=36813 RepID=UPI003CF5FE6B